MTPVTAEVSEAYPKSRILVKYYRTITHNYTEHIIRLVYFPKEEISGSITGAHPEIFLPGGGVLT
jgi:hypothetical protein